MAKFKAGDMIVGYVETGDGEFRWSTLMVNRIIDDKFYSLDNGSGFSDARDTISSVDSEYELAD